MKLPLRHAHGIRIDLCLLFVGGRTPELASGRAEPSLPKGKDGHVGQDEDDEERAHAVTVMTA